MFGIANKATTHIFFVPIYKYFCNRSLGDAYFFIYKYFSTEGLDTEELSRKEELFIGSMIRPIGFPVLELM